MSESFPTRVTTLAPSMYLYSTTTCKISNGLHFRCLRNHVFYKEWKCTRDRYSPAVWHGSAMRFH
jgi:hypothetical protein